MELSKKPVTGMKDILPEETILRDYVKDVIRKTYASYGFAQIETPCMERLENLLSRQGGDNEKLIFKTLKRGEKLDIENAKTETDLSDMGLRYDLTLPLARFYANNKSALPFPFKALQMGNVWRADRPQKGRFRQFMQCDIDIIGEAGNLAEIELILATSETIARLGFSGFKIRVNDRRILKAVASLCGIEQERFDTFFIILDKMDKTGLSGVREELISEGFNKDAVDKCVSLFDRLSGSSDPLSELDSVPGGFPDGDAVNNLKEIIDSVRAVKTDDFDIVFDPSLVRGMSYYTGPVFEISVPRFNASCGGGGRYDKMIGKFTGQDVPACGFSIGFERIVLLLKESGFRVPETGDKIAYLIEKGVENDELSSALSMASEDRKRGATVLIARMNKNKKFQKQTLTEQGYGTFKEIYKKPRESKSPV